MKIQTFFQKIKSRWHSIKTYREVKRSKLFDRAFYLQNNPDIDPSKINPLKHYLLYGGFEGRNPSAGFDSALYLQHYPDVRISGINPLLHFIRFGEKDGRKSFPANSFQRANISSDLKLIAQSTLFDEAFYLRANSDVKEAGVDPLEHYYFKGFNEGRNPSFGFDTYYYQMANAEVKKSGMNPLVHYLKHGINEGLLPKPIQINEDDSFEKADIHDVDCPDENTAKLKIAVVCHLFHPDLTDEFAGYFSNIPVPFDLFITTTLEKETIVNQLIAKTFPNIRYMVIPFENQGRDIMPFLKVFKTHLSDYDVVCKVHTKKSDYNYNLLEWRRYLLEQLLGNPMIIKRIISEFSQNKNLGLIWPVPFPYLSFLRMDKGWGSRWSKDKNQQFAKQYLSEFLTDDPGDDFEFPAGSMFWFRPAALQNMTKKTDELIFETETDQIDGTLAHAIERMFGVIAHQSGYTKKTVFFKQELIHATEKKINWLNHSKSILFVTQDLYRAGAQIVLLTTMQWMKKHTSLNLFVLALKKGNDGGKLFPTFQKVARVFIWEEFRVGHNEAESMKLISQETGKIDLIYGNTIIAASIYPLLKIFNAPYITHIHELEKSIQKYASAEVRKTMSEFTSLFIADSKPVMENLIQNHAVADSMVVQIDEFIHTEPNEIIDRNMNRLSLNLPTDKVLVWGCGTIYWRKGTDIFIETAKKLKDKGFTNFHFYWIGENHWTADSEEFGTWNDWENYILDHNLSGFITFMGAKENPKKYFNSGDIFFLSSREEPYGIVCLEAAEGGSPIVCFDETGGMPYFVGNDAGTVVKYLDVESAADEIGRLITDEKMRNEKGKQAQSKLLQNNTDEVAVPRILQICRSVMKCPPMVSVIVPVYNHEAFLEARMESILNQNFRDFEILILDDASTDNSLRIAKTYESHPFVKVYSNQTNSGSPFLQWQKGISLARGKYIWIAEGDDTSAPSFLDILLPELNDPDVKLVFCASHRCDENGEVYDQHYIKAGHYDNLNYPRERWKSKYLASGLDEITNALAIKCTIPNVSAVIFKSETLSNVDFLKSATFKSAGDWSAYISILKTGKISYNPMHLNFHRVHSDSVVARNKRKAADLLPDFFEIHKTVLEQFDISENVFHLLKMHVTDVLRSMWTDLADEEFSQLYNVALLEEIFHSKN